MATKTPTPELEGWGSLLAQTTVNRPEKKTMGPGNDLPEARVYAILTPNRNYTGLGAGPLPYQMGRAETPDRELAWRLREDFGYQIEPVA